MATSSTSSSFSPPPEFLPPTEAVSEDNLQLNKDLESMTEEMENISVQLTCLAYEMVTLRANPELGESVQKLRDAHQSCKDSILGKSQSK